MFDLVGGAQEQRGWRLVVAFVGEEVEGGGGSGDGELDGKDGGPSGIGGAGDGVTEEEEVEDKDDAAGGVREGRECGAGGAVEAEMEEDEDGPRDNGDAVVERDDVDTMADGHDVREAAPPSPCPEMGCMGMCRRSARVSDAKPEEETDEGDMLSERDGG